MATAFQKQKTYDAYRKRTGKYLKQDPTNPANKKPKAVAKPKVSRAQRDIDDYNKGKKKTAPRSDAEVLKSFKQPGTSVDNQKGNTGKTGTTPKITKDLKLKVTPPYDKSDTPAVNRLRRNRPHYI